MWLEHYTNDNRWREGYKISNRPNNESGIDINKYIWQYKKNMDKNFISLPKLVAYQSAKESALFKNFPISRIPNPIDTQVWKPRVNYRFKKYMGISKEKFLILICGTDIIVDEKSIDLFKEAIEKLIYQPAKLQLEFWAAMNSKEYKFSNLETIPLSKYTSEKDLVDIYNICDLVIVPSRQDNYPNVILEA